MSRLLTPEVCIQTTHSQRVTPEVCASLMAVCDSEELGLMMKWTVVTDFCPFSVLSIVAHQTMVHATWSGSLSLGSGTELG